MGGAAITGRGSNRPYINALGAVILSANFSSTEPINFSEGTRLSFVPACSAVIGSTRPGRLDSKLALTLFVSRHPAPGDGYREPYWLAWRRGRMWMHHQSQSRSQRRKPHCQKHWWRKLMIPSQLLGPRNGPVQCTWVAAPCRGVHWGFLVLGSPERVCNIQRKAGDKIPAGRTLSMAGGRDE